MNRRDFFLGTGAFATSSICDAAADDAITILAASSLTNVLESLAANYRKRQILHCVFGSSATLARQIEQGVRADIFASADTQWMDYLEERRLVDSQSRRDVLGNRLALVARAGSPVRVDLNVNGSLRAALGDRAMLAVADPDYVPAGRYAKAALTALGMWSGVAERLARADSVRGALALVSRAEAPLGIVYTSDAQIEPSVRVVAIFPAASHPRIVYPFAMIAGARSAASIAAFDYLTGAEAANSYRSFGFEYLVDRRSSHARTE